MENIDLGFKVPKVAENGVTTTRNDTSDSHNPLVLADTSVEVITKVQPLVSGISGIPILWFIYCPFMTSIA